MSFENIFYLALVLALVPIFWWGHMRRKPMGHTQVGIHKNVRTKPLVGWIPIAAVVLMWAGFAVAFAGLRQTTYADQQTVEARDIVIMVDTSGSMNSALQNKDQQDFAQSNAPTPSTTTAQPKPATRANGARMGVKLFAEQRKGDRMALLLFDDEVYEACLFTFDQTIIQKKIPVIDQYNGGGTNFEGPVEGNSNSKTGAIQGGINFFRTDGQAKSKVLILVTDGEDRISDKRFQQLADQIQEEGIRLYVLGIGESWTNGSMLDLRKFSDAVGGKVFLIGDTQALKDGFAEINKLEKSKIVVERTQDYKPLYWMVLLVSALGLIVFLGMTAVVREET